MTDSSAPGYLSPAASPAPLQGDGLNTLLQPVIVGITGLPGPMVRPAFQEEPPNIPDAGEAWAAFRYAARPSDTFPSIVHEDTPDGGQDRLRRHETIEVLVSFYDLGTSGLADTYASLLRDGLGIPQNVEPLIAHGMGLVSVGVETTAPVLIKIRWQYRVDLPFTLRREVVRVYPIKSVLTAQVTLEEDSGITVNITTN